MLWITALCHERAATVLMTIVLYYKFQIPLQDNSSDCGVFMLQFVESLLGTIQQGLPPPSVAEEWASYNKTQVKRKEIEQLITELQTRVNTNR